MRRPLVAAIALALGLAGCGGPRSVAQIEDCVYGMGAEVTRPAPAERVSPDLPRGVRYETRGFFEGEGQVLYFRAPDEATARDLADRLAELQERFGARDGEVKRDGTWVVQLDVPRQIGQDAFNCVR